ncbi:MAG TPA: hypothetical protein VN673_06120, partial [Clostridia bacterium]|nr:hypothetical protein [Clostridia bacterium]
PAVLAWEQALWLDPFHAPARNNLAFARKAAQVESPSLAWYEAVSSWLPPGWWAWIAGLSLWSAVGLGIMPGILRQPRKSWHQALAAVCMAIFLLSLPAHAGVTTRSSLGYLLPKSTPLRLTPTAEAESITQLAGGEPARIVRRHGTYLLIRTPRAQGWVAASEFGKIAQERPSR